METINYPLLYFYLRPNVVLGILVGTDYQLVQKDVKTLKTAMKNHLQKQYKKFDDYWYFDIDNPKLKIFEVKIRPTYRTDSGAYPANNILKVPVPVVFGENEDGYYECYLPLFDQSFYYYDTRQLRSLVTHLATDVLNQLPPEKINSKFLYPKAQLDTVALKINSNRKRKNNTDLFKRKFVQLEKLAVKYPFNRAQRKLINPFPEAAWEQEGKVAEVVDKLIASRANLLLVGKNGVGKSAVLRQAIKKLTDNSRKGGVPINFWQLMAQRITASARYLGEWQETVEALIEELQMDNGVLWVIDVMRLIQSGGSGAEDSVAAFMISFLQQNQLQLIGEVTNQELESMRRLLPGFVENFQIIQIDELPESKIQIILKKIAEFSEKQLKIKISGDALSMTYRLLLRYFPYESFPGKGIKFLGQSISSQQIKGNEHIGKREVLDTFIKQTGLPELFLRDEMILDQKELHQFFEDRIIGQPEAVRQMSGIVKIYKAGLNNPGKPISTMIFAGLTGVGKTASAKALADYFFGKGQKRSPLIRIDMSEFQHPYQISRFIGSGREVGQVVKEVREHPFSVLLLDEVEKASKAIFDALLNVLDEGIMVDAFGRITSFRNTIIIMTTNLGASNRQSIGYSDDEDDEKKYRSAISKFFRPEFVNRIDHIVIFNDLKQEDIEKITHKELDDLKKREGFVKNNIQLEFDQSIIDHLVEIGFDPKYGARPLQRAIEQTVVNPMAYWLLDHPEAKNTKVKVSFEAGLLKVDEE